MLPLSTVHRAEPWTAGNLAGAAFLLLVAVLVVWVVVRSRRD